MSGNNNSDNSSATVFYDGSCPVCRREIAYYRGCPTDRHIRWVDVAQAPVAALPDELSREAALGRFHVRTRDGRLLDGAAAFAHLWSAIPRFRLLGRVARVWPLSFLMELGYCGFLHIRPAIRRVMSSR